MKKIISSVALSCSLFVSAVLFPETVLSAQIESASDFTELKSAISNVDNNGTIIVTASFNITEQLTIPEGKKITIKGTDSSCVLSRDASYTGVLFGVPSSASLSLASIVLDGASLTSARPLILVNGGTCLLYDGSVLRNNINSNNLPGGGGGGAVSVTLGGELNMFYGALISGNTAYNGSGVMLSGSDSAFFMDGGSIYSNNADRYGGGVYAAEGTNFVMTGGSITSNTAGESGGGVNLNKASLKITDGIISSNTSNGTGGGGIFISQGSPSEGYCSMSGGSITSNNAPYGNGGGVSANGGTRFIFIGGSIDSNDSAKNGGGIYLNNNAVLEMSGGTIISNSAQAGGGIYLNLTSGAELSGGIIHANSNQDIYQNKFAGLSSFELESPCPHCGRPYGGLFKDSRFTSKLTSPESGQLTLYSKYGFDTDGQSNQASAPKSAEAEEKFPVEMTGGGQDSGANLQAGDTQYIPSSVQLGSRPPSAAVSVGRISSTMLSEEIPGDYSIRVTFQKQVWSGTEWSDLTDETYIISLNITIVPKQTAPSITGPSVISLTEGYSSAISEYTIAGYPVPDISVSGIPGAAINSDGILHLPDGLLPGEYSLTIKAVNGNAPDASYAVTIKVAAADKPDSSPATGDSSSSLLWLIISLSALFGFIRVRTCRLRKQADDVISDISA